MRRYSASRLMAAPSVKICARVTTESFGSEHEFFGRQKISSPCAGIAASVVVEGVAWVIMPFFLGSQRPT